MGAANTRAYFPNLKAKGYGVLLVDQRSGGGHYGSENRTVKARDGKTKYCAAYADMEGALSFRQNQKQWRINFRMGQFL